MGVKALREQQDHTHTVNPTEGAEGLTSPQNPSQINSQRLEGLCSPSPIILIGMTHLASAEHLQKEITGVALGVLCSKGILHVCSGEGISA